MNSGTQKSMSILLAFAMVISMMFAAVVPVKAHEQNTPTDYDASVIEWADALVEAVNIINVNDDYSSVDTSNVGEISNVLLDAFKITKDPKYLAAAGIMADALKDWKFSAHAAHGYVQNFDFYFLARYGRLAGNVIHSNWAMNEWRWWKGEQVAGEGDPDYYADGNQGALVALYLMNYSDGYTLWQCAYWIDAAREMGDIAWASNMADEVTTDTTAEGGTYSVVDNLDTGDEDAYIGAATMLMALHRLDSSKYAKNISRLRTFLEENQNPDGSWMQQIGSPYPWPPPRTPILQPILKKQLKLVATLDLTLQYGRDYVSLLPPDYPSIWYPKVDPPIILPRPYPRPIPLPWPPWPWPEPRTEDETAYAIRGLGLVGETTHSQKGADYLIQKSGLGDMQKLQAAAGFRPTADAIRLSQGIALDTVLTKKTSSGSDEVDNKDGTGIVVYKGGNGAPTISTGNYDSFGGSSLFNAIGNYFDVQMNDHQGVDIIEIRFYYTPAQFSGLDESSLRLNWWNGPSWVTCSHSGVNTSEDYIWAIITSTSTPSSTDLKGTPFGGSGTPVPSDGGGTLGGGGWTPPAPPKCTRVWVTDITQSLADIHCETNKSARCQVRYWASSSSQSSPLEAKHSRKHLIQLTDLTPNNEYYFHILLRDAEGNRWLSDEYSFATLGMLATFSIDTLSISPTEVTIGEVVTISVLVANTGDLAGNYELTLKIDDVDEATEEVTLDAGASQEITFTTFKDVAGSYLTDVNGFSGTFVVKEEPGAPPSPPSPPHPPPSPPSPPHPPPSPPPAKPVNWALLGSIIAGCGVVFMFILLVAARRRA